MKVQITERALSIATSFHRGQTDKAGKPYIFHCIRVGMNFPDNYILMSVGFLHDIVEDCNVTVKDLIEKFGAEISHTVGILTKGKREDYFVYIGRIAKDKNATLVKLADLEDNMDESRLDRPTSKDIARLEKYKKAKQILLDIQL